jgi:hypothetical protein
MNDDYEKPDMVYVEKELDINPLKQAFEDSYSNLSPYFDECADSYNERRNLWVGKTHDLKRHGDNVFPFDGCSDIEVNVVGERIDTFVAILDQALQRSHIKAFPTSASSLAKAGVVSSFLKWMRSSYIPNFRHEMELGANHLLEKGLMVTYIGWQKETRTYNQAVGLDQIAEMMPEMVDLILSGSDDKLVGEILQQGFPLSSKGQVKKAVKLLRQTGKAEFPMPRVSVDRPTVTSCSPDGEVVFPPCTTDPQRAPYVFWKTYLTQQELEKKKTPEGGGWDEEWVDDAISRLAGRDLSSLDQGFTSGFTNGIFDNKNSMVMVVYAYQRLIDEDGSEGIYYTVFHPEAEGYAIHELVNGADDYPFVVTKLSSDRKRLYDTTNFSKMLRGSQKQIKLERDSRIDRASYATMPPLFHPAGRAPTDWGPGRRIPYKRLGEIAFGPIPPADSGSERIEAQMVEQADKAVGLVADSVISSLRQQRVVDRYLSHVQEVLSRAWKLFQRMGPDEIFFQVTGNPNPQTLTKGDPDDNFSITVSFDSQSLDPESVKAQLEAMVSILPLDKNGRVDMDMFFEFFANSISPILADAIMRPAEEAKDKMMKDVTSDLTSIYSGIEVAARPNGADMALQVIQSYAQQPDIAKRLQQDEAFGARLTKYAEQYQFTLQQAQNAQIGRIGTAPASVGGNETQTMQQ